MCIRDRVLASVIGALFIASCSNEMAVESSSDSAGGGKAYAEFMACTAGPDFSAENAMKMIADWQKLITADSLLGAWGYVPAAETNSENSSKFISCSPSGKYPEIMALLSKASLILFESDSQHPA